MCETKENNNQIKVALSNKIPKYKYEVKLQAYSKQQR